MVAGTGPAVVDVMEFPIQGNKAAILDRKQVVPCHALPLLITFISSSGNITLIIRYLQLSLVGGHSQYGRRDAERHYLTYMDPLAVGIAPAAKGIAVVATS